MMARSWFLFLLFLFSFAPQAQAAENSPTSEPINDLGCPSPVESRIRRHTIRAGETLDSIAQQYNLIPATLMGINPTLRAGQVTAGAEILIPPYNGIFVRVPAGQTWQQVAAAYNIRPDVLFEVNGCQSMPELVFVPGVNWSPNSATGQSRPDPTTAANALAVYPLPTNAEILLGYGWHLQPASGQVEFHSGVDLRATEGTPVLASGRGVVAFAGDRANYGNLVVINHPGGKQTRYAHLGTITIRSGQQIQQGDTLGTVGTTGRPDVNEPHLHFEVRYNSDLGWVAENPELYLSSTPVSQR